MAHFAKVLNGKVEKVIVADDDYFNTFVDNSPGRWIETSYDTYGGVHASGGTPLRKNFAGVGMIYDEDTDAFYDVKPYSSWTLNTTTCLWEPPVTKPTDGNVYEWNEENYQAALSDSSDLSVAWVQGNDNV